MADEKQLKLLEAVLDRLDTLIKITAINAFQGKSIVEVVRLLSDLGFQNKDIAMILGTTPPYVANVRHNLKKQRAKQAKEDETIAGKE